MRAGRGGQDGGLHRDGEPAAVEQVADLKALVADMNAGKVQWLVMLGVNPLYSAPADLEFADAFNKVPNTVHLGSHVDETGVVCRVAHQQGALSGELVGCAGV
jgi:hypothetical protein